MLLPLSLLRERDSMLGGLGRNAGFAARRALLVGVVRDALDAAGCRWRSGEELAWRMGLERSSERMEGYVEGHGDWGKGGDDDCWRQVRAKPVKWCLCSVAGVVAATPGSSRTARSRASPSALPTIALSLPATSSTVPGFCPPPPTSAILRLANGGLVMLRQCCPSGKLWGVREDRGTIPAVERHLSLITEFAACSNGAID